MPKQLKAWLLRFANNIDNFPGEDQPEVTIPNLRAAGAGVILSVLYAPFDEIDLEKRTWTIPAGRTKTGKAHRVPLSDRALEILSKIERGPYLFRGRWEGASLSNMTFLMLLRRLEVEATAHGFRSSFRDWAAAETGFSSEVCEQALGHAVKDKTEAAYRRGDLFELRRDLMAAWAEFIG